MPKSTRSQSPRASKTTNPKRSGRQRPPALTASTADKHALYQESVQAPETEMEFVDVTFRSLRRRKAMSFREDFCGTALLSATWIKSHAQRTATGVDFDQSVLDWGIAHNLAPLDEPGDRITLIREDVREKRSGRFDIVGAFNFSYWVFKTRETMRDYFRGVRRALNADGLFVLDAYGGWESQQPMLEPRRVQGGFTYVWDQDSFCPITHDITNHIHFEFRDGSKLDKAFTYEWRYWTLPELLELLREAGFSNVKVHWDDTEDDEDAVFRPKRKASNQPGWLAYIVAER